MTGIVNANQTMAFAAISVTYPAGSTCTCTSGSRSLKARGTSGKFIFFVPSSGDWTVSCTDGDKVASHTVSITEEGQTERVELAYRVYIYNFGSDHPNTGGWNVRGCAPNGNFPNNYETPSVKWNSDNIQLSVSGGYTYGLCHTRNKFDLTPYSKLYMDVDVTYAPQGSHVISLTTQNGSIGSYINSNQSATTGYAETTGRRLMEADISHVGADQLIAIAVGAVITAKVYAIYME